MTYLFIGVVVLAILNVKLKIEYGIIKGEDESWASFCVGMFLVVITWPVWALLMIMREL